MNDDTVQILACIQALLALALLRGLFGAGLILHTYHMLAQMFFKSISWVEQV